MVATTADTDRPSPAAQPQPLERRPTEPEAVFIVGVGSSGTSLLRRLLETSERIAIARENHYVGHHLTRHGARFYFRHAGDLSDDANVRRLVDFIYDGEFQRKMWWRNISNFWRWLIAEVPREEVERYLLAGERSEGGVLASFLRIHADREGKAIIGEKTPAHLKHVDTLISWFPDARVLHIIRDPRAVYVSDLSHRRKDRRKPYRWLMPIPFLLQSVVLVQTVFFWRSAVRLHQRYQRAHGTRYKLIRFEDLVTRQDETLDDVFAFVGTDRPADATDRMDMVKHGTRTVEQGIDPGAATRWRERIHPFAKRFLETFLGGYLRRLDYPSR